MTQSHVVWALVGMVAYSLTALFVKLAMRAGLSSSLALAIATSIVCTACWTQVLAKDELGTLAAVAGSRPFWWAAATGTVLAIAVMSFFRALELGPASIVVPIYGMFIVGGSLLGILMLGEPLTWQKAVGVAAAVVGVVLISV